jgi:RNA polymerase sigma-70 factor (ECF subfamily)
MEVAPNLSEKGARDYQLVQQALAGDRRSYAELLNNYRDSLYFLMLKMSNDTEDAEDLTIEAFGKAFRSLQQYSPTYAFSTWLFKIAANNCIDYMRRKKKYSFSLNQSFGDDAHAEELSVNVASTAPDPEEAVIIKQRAKVLKGVVEKLKPHYRLLIEMRYYKELSYEEIATELNLPLGTVKAQLFRAREFLYQILYNSTEKF